MKNERGSTLALCVLLMALLSIFVCEIGGILIVSRKSKMKELTTEKSFYIADSCIELTQIDLQSKVATQIAKTLGSIGFDEVPVTYIDPNTGDTEVYTPADFKKNYISYVMQVFSTSDIREGLRYNKTHKDPDDTSSPIIDADLLGATLTQNVAERFPAYISAEASASSTDKFKVETDIEQNMTYSDFGKAYTQKLEDPNYALPSNFNTGHLMLIYTITHPDGTQEKVRASFTFDMYNQILDICEQHSDLIYNKLKDGDTDETLKETTVNVDLHPTVVREYLIN